MMTHDDDFGDYDDSGDYDDADDDDDYENDECFWIKMQEMNE